jgi:hypothetical protein
MLSEHSACAVTVAANTQPRTETAKTRRRARVRGSVRRVASQRRAKAGPGATNVHDRGAGRLITCIRYRRA